MEGESLKQFLNQMATVQWVALAMSAINTLLIVIAIMRGNGHSRDVTGLRRDNHDLWNAIGKLRAGYNRMRLRWAACRACQDAVVPAKPEN